LGVYSTSLKVPANTPEDAPVEKTLEIEGAVLSTLHVQVPAGHKALARMAIFYGIKQIFPSEAGTWFRGDDIAPKFRLNWTLPEPKTTLTLKGWNEDDTYEHAFYLMLEVEERVEAARPWQVIVDFVAILKRLIGIP